MFLIRATNRAILPVLWRTPGQATIEKAWAISHSYGYYHPGAHAGQMFVAVGYPDLATQERAMQAMSQDVDWQRVAGELEKIAPLQEMYLTVITEEQ